MVNVKITKISVQILMFTSRGAAVRKKFGLDAVCFADGEVFDNLKHIIVDFDISLSTTDPRRSAGSFVGIKDKRRIRIFRLLGLFGTSVCF
jgi:thiamine biosynthesis protein ThiC